MNPKSETSSATILGKRRKWLRRFAAVFVFFVVLLAWLNGPGLRWLLPILARHFLAKKSMVVEMQVRGSVTGGLSLHDVRLTGGAIVDLRIGSAEPLYRFQELFEGKVRGLRISGIALEMDLDRSTGSGESQPFDIRKVVGMLRANQALSSGYEVEVQIESLFVHRSEELLVRSNNLRLSHAAGAEVWKVETGSWQLPEKQTIPAQSIAISWGRDAIGVDRLRIDESLRVEDVQFTTPEDLRPLLKVRCGVGASVFALQTTENFERIELKMSGPPVSLAQLRPYLAEPLTVEGDIAALMLRMEPKHLPIFGDETPPAMIFDLHLLTKFQNMQWRNGKLDDVDLTLSKTAEKSNLEARIAGHDGVVNAKADVLWNQNPTQPEDWLRAVVSYDIGIPELKDLLENLSPLLGITRPKPAVAPPASSLRAKGSLHIDGSNIGPMEAQISLNSSDGKLPELSLTARSQEGNIFTVDGGFGAVLVKASLDREAMKYTAEISAKDLSPENYQPWLAWMGIAMPTGMKTSLKWQGSGEIKEPRHSGQAIVETFSWKRSDTDELTANGQAKYDWPQKASVENLQLNLGDQQAHMNLTWAEGRLELREIELRIKEKLLLSGVASIPLASSVKSVRDFLLQPQKLDLRLTSEVLPLSIAEQWIKPGDQLPMTGTAKIDLQITGSPADPVVAANLQLKDGKSRLNSELPAVDLMVDLQGNHQKLSLSGLLLTARTAPVHLKAEMPFRPSAWAEDVKLIQGESIEASIEIPTIDLARLQGLVPQVKQLAGSINGNAIIGGTIGAPRINGALAVKNFSTRLPNEKIPPITEGSMNLTFTDQLVKVEKLNLSLAGGNIVIQGVADLTQPAKPTIDFTVRGDALPLWRDDAVIARANADLRIAGPWDLVRTSGEIGIIDSLLYKDFEIIPIGRPFTLPQAASLPALDANLSKKVDALPMPFADWPLAIRIKTNDPFLVRGNLARGSITADIKLGGTLGNPEPVGEAVIAELTASLPLSKLHISSGKVRLTAASGLDPVLDIRGTSRISNFDVSLYAYGPVSAPKILLTSEPPLPENEIMTLLATGTTTAGLVDQGAAQSKATQLLIEEFRRGRLPLGQRLLPLLSKLENVEIAVGEPDPYTGRKLASAKIPFFSRYFLYGAVDALGRTRSLLMFEMKMK